MTDIVNLSGLVPPKNLPDHSILQGTFSSSHPKQIFKTQPKEANVGQKLPIKRNIKKINLETFFLSDEIRQQVIQTIERLENAGKHQLEIDNCWAEIKNLFKNELNTLPEISKSGFKKNNGKFRKSTPFWNEELANLWLNLCANEKVYTTFKVRNNYDITKKAELRERFKNAQKYYDKRYRFYKIKSRKHAQELMNISAKDNPAEMWAKLKKLAEPVNNRVAMEIIREDGSISRDVKEVLLRWHKDISQLFSGIREDPDIAFDDKFYEEVLKKKHEFENLSDNDQSEKVEFSTQHINANISFQEVSKAIDKVKSGKAYLEIPNEMMKNMNAKLLLQKFFNLCFTTGLNPTDWSFSDVKPIPKKDKDQRDPLQNRCISIMCCVAKMYSSILNTRIQKY